MKNLLPKLILAIIIQNGLITETYASDYQIIQDEIKQSKARTFNEPNEPGRHINNTLEWYYNSLNQNLSSFSEKDTIETIKISMRTWSDISGIKFVYKGITKNNINNTKDKIITIGYWSNKAYTDAHGDNGGYSEVKGSGPVITEGHMILNAGDGSNSGSIPINLKELQGLITHEVGHLLAIAHSDNKESIMSADPYHSYEYQRTLRSDDIKIATQLYPEKSDSLTVVRPNLDIVIRSATFHSTNGNSSNVWAVLDFNGLDSSGNFTWKLNNYGINQKASSDTLSTTIRKNLDIVIQSATLYSENKGSSNVWAILKFIGTDTNNDPIWKLDNHGVN
ncbi:MAG: matrixin family metalloprotease [Methylococcales bacterium]|nr:matrixin family metalloprotease [Methylococcales bacterium]